MAYYGVQAVMVGIMNTIIRHFIAESVLYSGWGMAISILSLAVSVAVDSVFVLIYGRWIYPKILSTSRKVLRLDRDE